jgi:hypothetical protein
MWQDRGFVMEIALRDNVLRLGSISHVSCNFLGALGSNRA